ELEYRCGLSKSMDSHLGPVENTTVNEDPTRNDTDKNIHDSSDSSSYYKSFFYSYHNSSYMNNGSKNDESHYHFNLDDNDTNYGWNNHINSCIDSYLRSQICIDSSILSGSDNSNDNYIYNYICGEGGNSSEGKNFDIITRENVNYKKSLNSKMNICEQCGYHLKMRSSDRIELSIDPGTWGPMDEDMISLDPIEFQSEEELYKDRIDFYQRKTGLTEAIQTDTGQLNGIPIAIGVMDFQFMGGSMGSVVGEKITRLIEYATNNFLPLILVCASGGARMKEGSLSLMQMAKISSSLYDYQSNKKLFYVSILTSPTTGGVTASFGMLGDIIIAEPNAYIAFAGKRVIEQTLNKTIPEGSQAAEYLFHKGLFDPIVPRNPLKGVLRGNICIFRWGFPGKNRRIFLRFLMKDIQSIRIEVKEGIYARRILYREIRGQGAVPLTRTNENLTSREIEQKPAELAYFLRVPIEVF
ncbi:hypothetical protein ERO13_1Z050266v2, partial [Gossypium hirsutum]